MQCDARRARAAGCGANQQGWWYIGRRVEWSVENTRSRVDGDGLGTRGVGAISGGVSGQCTRRDGCSGRGARSEWGLTRCEDEEGGRGAGEKERGGRARTGGAEEAGKMGRRDGRWGQRVGPELTYGCRGKTWGMEQRTARVGADALCVLRLCEAHERERGRGVSDRDRGRAKRPEARARGTRGGG